MNERVAFLVHGFIKRGSTEDIEIPNDVTSLCLRYTGDSRNFDSFDLMTPLELGNECCGHGTVCGKCARYLQRVHFCRWVWSFCVMLVLSAKDIAALAVVSSSDCNTAISGTTAIDFLGVNAWLYIAATVDIVLCFLWISASVLADFWTAAYNFLFCKFLTERGTLIGVLSVGMQCITISFYSLWIVFGCILYSEMESDLSCSRMVLSWCILQSAFVVVVMPFCAFVVNVCGGLGERPVDSWLDEVVPRTYPIYEEVARQRQ